MIGKVEHSGSLRELQQVALWSEHKDLVLIKVHLELVHHLHVVTRFEYAADVVQPFVQSCFTLYALISPMGSHSPLGNLIHAFGAYLHLHPFLLRSEHGDMQTLISVRLWHRKPVAQSFGIRLIHVCHQ